MKMLITDVWELTGQERDWLLEHGIEVEICPDEALYEGDASQFELVACKFLFSYTPHRAVYLPEIHTALYGWL